MLAEPACPSLSSSSRYLQQGSAWSRSTSLEGLSVGMEGNQPEQLHSDVGRLRSLLRVATGHEHRSIPPGSLRNDRKGRHAAVVD
jgi:hypothetical protein